MSSSTRVSTPSRGRFASKPYLLAACGAAIFTYQGGRDIVNVLLPAIQVDFGLSYTALGLVAASYDWGHASMLLLGGYLSDRYGKKRCLLIGLAWFILANASIGLSPSPWLLTGLRFATGVAFGTYFVAGNSLLAEAFVPSERGRAIGLHYAGGSAGRFIIPIVGGMITVSLGWQLAFLPLSLTAAVAAVLFLLLRSPAQVSLQATGSAWETLWKIVLRNRQVIKVSAIQFLVIFANMAVIFVPVYLVRTWNLAISEAAIYTGIAALAGIPASPIVGELSDRLGWNRVVMVTLAADGLLLGIFPFVAPGPVLVMVLLGLGIVNRSISVVLAVATRASEPSHRAMSLGLVNTVGLLSLTVLSVLGGYIADVVGLSATFLFIALVAVVSCAVLGTTKLGRLDLRW